MPRRITSVLATLATLVVGFASPCLAQSDFPKQPVKIVIPFPPGGPTDTVGRLLAQKLQDAWGQPVLIDYKPGAGTVVGVNAVVKSPADGYTIGMVNSSLAVNPSLRRKMPYETPKDIAGITQLFNMQLAIAARPDAPYNTVKELIAYAKANPGKLNYGTPGAGSTTHLGAELLQREAGFDMQHIGMKGSAQAHLELIGGRIDLVVDPLLSLLPHVQAGRMKLLATMGEKRFDPAVPTVAETVPGFSVGALLGFIAPAGTPRAVLQRIQADTVAALGGADVQKRAQEYGLQIVGSSPEQFDRFIASEMQRWGRIVVDAKIEQE